MAQDDNILVPWKTGTGNIVINSSGSSVVISSDTVNDYIEREQIITFSTVTGDSKAELKVIQKGNKIILRDNAQYILRDSDGKVLIGNK